MSVMGDDVDSIISKLDKRQRLALRTALSHGNSGAAPTQHVRKLVRLGLAELTGHFHEPTEWGEVVRREPKFYLTALGEAVAQTLKDRISSAQSESRLKELIGLIVERKIREVELSDGNTVRHGSRKHVKDLERRIADLKRWRSKERKGSDARANYSRVIARLTQQLNAAKRSGLKENKSHDDFYLIVSYTPVLHMSTNNFTAVDRKIDTAIGKSRIESRISGDSSRIL